MQWHLYLQKSISKGLVSLTYFMLPHFQTTDTFTKPFRKIVKLTRETLLIFNSSNSPVTTPQVGTSYLMKMKQNLLSITEIATLKKIQDISSFLAPSLLLFYFKPIRLAR